MLQEFNRLNDEQKINVRLMWLFGIRAQLTRSNMNDRNNLELWEIINQTLEALFINPVTRVPLAPSLHVPSHLPMTVGNAKKVIEKFGTTGFDYYLPFNEKTKQEGKPKKIVKARKVIVKKENDLTK